MNFTIRKKHDDDRDAILKIFNHFVRTSYAAYPDQEIGIDAIEHIVSDTLAFLILEVDGKPVGFGFIKPFRNISTFRHTGVLTYFILPQYTGKGLGSKLLGTLIDAGKAMGITNYVAHISSRNDQSLRFHKKHGFRECGCLKDIGIKFGEYFDIVWVQKQLDD